MRRAIRQDGLVGYIYNPEGGNPMRIPISEIKLNPGRREAEPEDIKNLADTGTGVPAG